MCRLPVTPQGLRACWQQQTRRRASHQSQADGVHLLGTLPGAGALGVAEIITDSCQRWTQICGHSKAEKGAGRRSLPGASHPPSPAFV